MAMTIAMPIPQPTSADPAWGTSSMATVATTSSTEAAATTPLMVVPAMISVNGGNGNDLLQGGFNRDTLNGGNGNDSLYAYTAANIGGSGVGDVLNGDSGNDFIYGSGGNDTADGGNGDDYIRRQWQRPPPGGLQPRHPQRWQWQRQSLCLYRSQHQRIQRGGRPQWRQRQRLHLRKRRQRHR